MLVWFAYLGALLVLVFSPGNGFFYTEKLEVNAFRSLNPSKNMAINECMLYFHALAVQQHTTFCQWHNLCHCAMSQPRSVGFRKENRSLRYETPKLEV